MRIRITFGLILLSSTFNLSGQTSNPNPFGTSLKKYPRPAEAPKPKTEQSDLIRVKTELVPSEVLVVSQKGNPILGLKEDDFVVTEDGVPQMVEVFSAARDESIGRSIILVIGYGIMVQPYIHASVEAATVLIDKLGPRDKMAVVSDQVELVSPFSSNKNALKRAIASYEQAFWKLRRPEQTRCLRADSQYSSLLAALNELIGLADVRPVVIFQTDGDELPYLKPESKEWREMDKKYAPLRKPCPDKSYWEERPYGFEDIKDAVAVTGATVYSIVPGPRVLGVPEKEVIPRISRYVADVNRMFPRSEWAATQRSFEMLARWNMQWQSSMAEIAAFSGGYTEFLETPKDAERIYDNILAIMNNRYVVGYYLQSESTDGKRRKLKVQIKGHPEFGTLSRMAYISRPQ